MLGGPMRDEEDTNRREAAQKAWKTMHGPVWKAHRSERLSKQALENWATKFGFRIVFLDAASGYPRTGIVDALLFRIKPRSADQLELFVVQLKGGGSGLKPMEMTRLAKAATSIKATPLIILHHDQELHFLGGEPSFTIAKPRKAHSNA